MKKLITTVMFLVIFLDLFVTNPSKSEFYEYIEDSTERKINETQGTGIDAIDKSISALAGEYSKQNIKDITTRKDYYLLSIYTIKTSNQNYTYVGIVDHFFYVN